jgi:hypothetical protein
MECYGKRGVHTRQLMTCDVVFSFMILNMPSGRQRLLQAADSIATRGNCFNMVHF